MTIWWLILILGSLGAAAIAFIWLVVHLDKMGGGSKRGDLNSSIEAAAREDGDGGGRGQTLTGCR